MCLSICMGGRIGDLVGVLPEMSALPFFSALPGHRDCIHRQTVAYRHSQGDCHGAEDERICVLKE